jgi:CheY-like chemotaxis protein
LLKRQKTDKHEQASGPPRILVVDDNPDAAKLIGKILRRAGFEVAEVGDHQVALVTLANEPVPIRLVVAGFSTSGTSSCLKMLDAIRHSPEPKVATQRVVLVLDAGRQQRFAWQSGADDVLLRPYFAADLVNSVREAVDRRDRDRINYRRLRIEELGSEVVEAAVESQAGAHPPVSEEEPLQV